MTWRVAFLRQAYSDYKMFLFLSPLTEISLNHKLHYLQMATEKLAKGLITSPNGGPPERTHRAFLPFVRNVAIQNSALRNECQIENRDQYRAYLHGLQPLAEAIGQLSPEGQHHPNPEYPWAQIREGHQMVVSPLDYSFSEIDLYRPEMVKLLRFLEACFRLVEPEIR